MVVRVGVVGIYFGLLLAIEHSDDVIFPLLDFFGDLAWDKCVFFIQFSDSKLPPNQLILLRHKDINLLDFLIISELICSFSATPVWSPSPKPVMKTKFGNVLIRNGFVYGLDGVALECVELETGNKRWKKRRRPPFGHGQILLVGKTILILTEQGEVVLVEVTPEKYHELASMQVFDTEQITWNNPALAGDLLLIRNAKEAACYRLPLQ